MSDPIRACYEAVHYPALTHPQLHPARLLASARLWGLDPPPAARARVLDLGCGTGAQLRWVAQSLPGSRCLGVDLAETQIREARRRAAGIDNLRFACADLTGLDLGNQVFDLIIAHGVLTWVPDAVKDALFATVARHLAPGGVAMVSYNCLPGAQLREALRMLMQMEQERLGLAPGDVGAAAAMLDVLDTGMDGLDLPHADLLRQQLRRLRAKPPDLLRHDELDPVYEPLYLLEALQLARGHGLAYVADTDLLADWLACYPQSCRQAFARPEMDRFRALQYADFLANRAFRHSLFCRAEAAGAVPAAPDPARVPPLSLRSYLEPIDTGARPGAGSIAFRTRAGCPVDANRAALLQSQADQGTQTREVGVKDARMQALLLRCAERYPGAAHIGGLLNEADGVGGAADTDTALCSGLLRLASKGMIELCDGPCPAPPDPD
jgi:SAM-dependent methyltransferase